MTTPSQAPIDAKLKADGWSYKQREEFRMMLRAASEAGWVLVPRAEVEEAAHELTMAAETSDRPGHFPRFTELAARLHERSRG